MKYLVFFASGMYASKLYNTNDSLLYIIPELVFILVITVALGILLQERL